MIGSHNTFTYLSPKSKIFGRFKWLWRCQDKPFDEQYKLGVRFFDIRVFRESEYCWRVAHGLVNFKLFFIDLTSISNYISQNYPDAIFRLILEKGSAEDEIKFKESLKNLKSKNVYQVIVKKGWKVLYLRNGLVLDIIDYTLLSGKSFWYNLVHFNFNTIKHNSKSNPTITKEMVEDKNVVYFMDYV